MTIGSHFKGKRVFEHLREARIKGQQATQETHGLEVRGYLVGGADAARDSAAIVLIIFLIASALRINLHQTFIIPFFLVGFFLWRMGQGALIAWSRIERVNRLVQEEKHEIEHNREEEKAELKEMYEAKGFSGELLDTVIDVLMADDNKLLGIMLEEELGVSLETFDHPLKQALGGGIGILFSSLILLLSIYLFEIPGLIMAGFGIIIISTSFIAMLEKIDALRYVIWNLAITLLASGGAYFLTRFFMNGS